MSTIFNIAMEDSNGITKRKGTEMHKETKNQGVDNYVASESGKGHQDETGNHQPALEFSASILDDKTTDGGNSQDEQPDRSTAPSNPDDGTDKETEEKPLDSIKDRGNEITTDPDAPENGNDENNNDYEKKAKAKKSASQVQVNIKLNPIEYDEIKQEATEMGKSITAYFKTILIKRKALDEIHKAISTYSSSDCPATFIKALAKEIHPLMTPVIPTVQEIVDELLPRIPSNEDIAEIVSQASSKSTPIDTTKNPSAQRIMNSVQNMQIVMQSLRNDINTLILRQHAEQYAEQQQDIDTTDSYSQEILEEIRKNSKVAAYRAYRAEQKAKKIMVLFSILCLGLVIYIILPFILR